MAHRSAKAFIMHAAKGGGGDLCAALLLLHISTQAVLSEADCDYYGGSPADCAICLSAAQLRRWRLPAAIDNGRLKHHTACCGAKAGAGRPYIMFSPALSIASKLGSDALGTYPIIAIASDLQKTATTARFCCWRCKEKLKASLPGAVRCTVISRGGGRSTTVHPADFAPWRVLRATIESTTFAGGELGVAGLSKAALAGPAHLFRVGG
jgi:hypothetical protein